MIRSRSRSRVPNEWTQLNGGPWVDGGQNIGVSITASSDLKAFNNCQDSGVLFEVSADLAKLGGYVQVLDVMKENYASICKYDSRLDYDDGYYRGKADVWKRCNGGNNKLVVISAVSKSDPTAFIILVHVLMTKDADQAALDKLISSFDVIGTLP